MSQPATSEQEVKNQDAVSPETGSGESLVRVAHAHFVNRVLEHGRRLFDRIDESVKLTTPPMRRIGDIARLTAMGANGGPVDGYEAMFELNGEGADHDATAVHLVFRFESRLADEAARRTDHTVSLFVEDIIKDERLPLFTLSAQGHGVDDTGEADDAGAQKAIDESVGAALETENAFDKAKVIAAIGMARAEVASQDAQRTERAKERAASSEETQSGT